jgi:cytochrome P450
VRRHFYAAVLYALLSAMSVRGTKMADTTAQAAPLYWDPYDQELYPNPYPVFRRLREEAPVYYNDKYDFYAVSRYDDVQAVLSNRDTFISGHGVVLEHIKNNIPVPKGMFIAEDPPLHTIHRTILTRVFTPRKMAALEPQIRGYCAKALDPLVEGGSFDFIENLGAEMPMRVIGMLLGIPEQDLKSVQKHVDDSLYAEPGKPMDMEGKDFIGHHFDDYIDWREKNPSDDLMTELLRAEFVDETGKTRTLSRMEILVFVNILAGAGNETTNRLIGWTGKILAQHPDQRRKIHQDRSLINQSIEEILRFEPPGPSVARYVSKDIEMHGVKIRAGAAMLALVAAANRDERKFVDGDAFNIQRERLPHFTFGFGFHNCLGNALARVEGRVALDEILTRFPEWDVDMNQAKLSPSSTTRGWDTMPAYVPGAKRVARKPKVAPEAAPLEGAEIWTLTMRTPAGPQELTAHIARDGARLSGRVDSPMGAQTIKNGKINGDEWSWQIDVTKPMTLTLSFDVVVTGDTMAGAAKLGVFGTAEVTGSRRR